jgi:hypothetical protein
MPPQMSTFFKRLMEDHSGARATVATKSAGEAFKTFLVQCETYRCMAYRDGEGRWRAAYDNRELAGVRTVICTLD